MSNLKWNPKDPDGLIGVPGKGYIKTADFSQEDLDNLIKRAKNRGIDVHSFLIKAGLVPAKPQLELEIEPAKPVIIPNKEVSVIGMNEGSEDEQPEQEEQPKRVRRTKAQTESDKK